MTGLSLGALFSNNKIGLYDEEDMVIGRDYTEILRDGIYKTYDNGVHKIVKNVQTIKKGVLMGSMEETKEEEFKIHEKVPFNLFLKIAQFYTDITVATDNEAAAYIYKNTNGVDIPEDLKEEYGEAILEEKDYVILVPKQKNSKGGTSSQNDRAIEWFNNNWVAVVETHSHNSMSAFWSNIDDRNEKARKLCMYLVLGTLNRGLTYELRYFYGGEFVEHLDLSELFDVPVIKDKIVRTVIDETGVVSEKEVGETEVSITEHVNELDFKGEGVISYPKEAWEGQVQLGFRSKTVKKEKSSGFLKKGKRIRIGADNEEEVVALTEEEIKQLSDEEREMYKDFTDEEKEFFGLMFRGDVKETEEVVILTKEDLKKQGLRKKEKDLESKGNLLNKVKAKNKGKKQLNLNLVEDKNKKNEEKP